MRMKMVSGQLNANGFFFISTLLNTCERSGLMCRRIFFINSKKTPTPLFWWHMVAKILTKTRYVGFVTHQHFWIDVLYIGSIMVCKSEIHQLIWICLMTNEECVGYLRKQLTITVLSIFWQTYLRTTWTDFTPGRSSLKTQVEIKQLVHSALCVDEQTECEYSK